MSTSALAQPAPASSATAVGGMQPREWMRSAGRLTFLVAVVTLLRPEYVLPPPAAVSAPATAFSSARALQHLRTIAAAPHPVGSEHHLLVVQHLQRELSGLGLQIDEQRTTYADLNRRGDVVAGRVRNLLGRKAGHASTKSVVLVAHYDSPITSPGAADNGAAVAALLETARALSAGPTLRNDVLFLFTDGEELGLYGAKAFRRDHPAFQEAGVVLNFEARGTEGPSTMFETGRRSGPVVEAMLTAVPSPYASSLAPSLYELMPNNTDFTVFRNAGLPGLNFAFAKNWQRYHTQLDSIESLDPRSLQHHGEYATALARHLGNIDLRGIPGDNLIYFNLLGPFIAAYPARWAGALAAVAVVAYVVLVASGLRRGRLRPRALAVALLLLPLTAAAAGLLSKGYLTWAVGGIPDGFLLYRESHYQAAFILLTALATVVVFLAFARWLNAEHALIGTLGWWVAAACASAVYLPGASYVFVWPLFLNLGVAWILRMPAWSAARGWRLMVFYLLPLCSALILVPPATMLSTSFIADNAYLLSIYAAICLALLTPHVAALVEQNRWTWAAAFMVATLAVTAAMYRGPVHDAEHPKNNHVMYVANTARDPMWIASSLGLDPWVSEVLASGRPQGNASEFLPAWYSSGLSRSGRLLSATAPRTDLQPPDATVVKDVTTDKRTLTLHIASRRRAPKLAVRLTPGPLRLIDVNGQRLEAVLAGSRGGSRSRDSAVIRQDALVVYHHGPGDEGMELQVETRPGPITVEIVDQTYDLPDPIRRALIPRPSSTMPMMSTGDGTVIIRSRTF